jgi:hypothetical protein
MKETKTIVLTNDFDLYDIPTVIRRDTAKFWSLWIHFRALVSMGTIFWR